MKMKIRKSRQIVEKIMSLKEMERFINRTNYEINNQNPSQSNVPIIIQAIYCRNLGSFTACAKQIPIERYLYHYYYFTRFNIILINDWALMTYSKSEIQAVLLHEVGHFVKGMYKEMGYMNEYNAQKWAINKAKEMKLFKVVKILKNELEEEWINLIKIGGGIYYKAAKHAKKVGLI